MFTVTCLEKDGRQVAGIFLLGLNNSYAYCRLHYASPTFMCYCLPEIYLHLISLWVALLISFGKFGKILQSGFLGWVGRVILLNITIFAVFRILEECYFINMRISLTRWEWMGSGFFFTRKMFEIFFFFLSQNYKF